MHPRHFVLVLVTAMLLTIPAIAIGGGETCADALPLGSQNWFDLNTTNGRHDDFRPYHAPCNSQDPLFGLGPDLVYVYQVTAPPAGLVHFLAEPRGDWDLTLYAFRGSCSPSNCVMGANQGGPGQGETLAFPVSPLVPYFLVVDGEAGAFGDFTIMTWSDSDTLCRSVDAAPLPATRDTSGARGKDASAVTHAANRVVPLAVCHRLWQVPWPRFQNGQFLYIADARERRNVVANAVGTRQAVASVLLQGSYTVHRKNELQGYIRCESDYSALYNYYLRSDFNGGVTTSAWMTVTVDPFFNEVNYPLNESCKTISTDPAPAPCTKGQPIGSIQIKNGPLLRNVAPDIPHRISLACTAIVTGWGNSAGLTNYQTFDLNVSCPDPAAASDPDQASGGGPARVSFRPSLIHLQKGIPLQGEETTLPPDFSSTFVAADTLGFPVPMAAISSPAFASDFYLAGLVTPFGAPGGIGGAPDQRRLFTCNAGVVQLAPGDTLLAPSDLCFDPSGAFANRLLAVSADQFDPALGAPLDRHGTVVALDGAGNLTNVASGLHSPAALAVSGGGGWDGNLYVAEADTGEITRVTPGGFATPFATGFRLPLDLQFGSGAFGNRLFVVEADTLLPGGSLPHSDAGRIRVLSSGGAASRFAGPLHVPTCIALTAAGSRFGEYLYVGLYNRFAPDSSEIPQSGSIVRVRSDGTVETFATGLERPMRIAFRPPDRLYVSVSGGVLEITAQDPGATPPRPRDPGYAFRLHAVSPNPAESSARLRFDLPRPMSVRLEAYNAAGAVVARLAEGPQAAGRHEIAWGGDRGDGRPLEAGVYFIRLQGEGGESAASRLVVLR